MPLHDTDCRNAEPRPKAYKLGDSHGLYLLVTPTGAKYWRYKYRIGGREKTYAIGVYPLVSLKVARVRHFEARQLVDAGIDPSAKKKEQRVEAKRADGTTFKSVALEWFDVYKKTEKPTASTCDKILWILENKWFPAVGEQAVERITARDLLDAILPFEKRGNLETAHRMRQRVTQVFRYAKKAGYVTENVALDLAGELTKKKKVRHHPGITDPREFGELLRALHGYSGQPATCAALKLCPLVFLRPMELRTARWREFDLKAKVWRVSAQSMKGGQDANLTAHVVPLSRQAVEILRELHPLTGDGEFVFPAIGKRGRPLSENTLGSALNTLGYKGRQTWHGFRTSASTMLNEADYPGDWIELQLAHKPKDDVRDSYNRAKRLNQRTRMLQDWADYLDQLRANKTGAKLPGPTAATGRRLAA